MADVIVVLWEWAEGPHKGGRFWATHNTPASDGRLRDWPNQSLRALGAAKVAVTEGEGLALLKEPPP